MKIGGTVERQSEAGGICVPSFPDSSTIWNSFSQSTWGFPRHSESHLSVFE